MSFVRYIDDNPDALQEQTLQTLYPGTTSGKSLTSVVPPENAIAFVKKLATGAKTVANANACGSVLAGQTSESDEHEDVGVWLAPGEYGIGHERDAVEALGLKTWRNKKVMLLKLLSYRCGIDASPFSLGIASDDRRGHASTGDLQTIWGYERSGSVERVARRVARSDFVRH